MGSLGVPCKRFQELRFSHTGVLGHRVSRLVTSMVTSCRLIDYDVQTISPARLIESRDVLHVIESVKSPQCTIERVFVVVRCVMTIELRCDFTFD